jgi:hypothetical protein
MMTVAAMMMMMRTILNAQEKQRRSESHFLRFRKGAKYPQTESEGKTVGVIEKHFLLFQRNTSNTFQSARSGQPPTPFRRQNSSKVSCPIKTSQVRRRGARRRWRGKYTDKSSKSRLWNGQIDGFKGMKMGNEEEQNKEGEK